MSPPTVSTPPAGRLTPDQKDAVESRGNVLVMAGAGTGKTKTLVERCLDCLARDGARLDELLVVTFTEAAAAEMRHRLRRAIEERTGHTTPVSPSDAAAGLRPDSFWAEQLARFDLAHIGTLHSFCLALVREHFYELGLDPRVAMLDDGEARQLANETIEEQFAAHYAGEDPFSLAVQDLIQVHGGGRDESIRHLVLQLHHYSQARPDAAGWLARQRAIFAAADPVDWRHWLVQAVGDWCNDWLPVLRGLGAPGSGANPKAVEIAAILSRLPPAPPAPPTPQGGRPQENQSSLPGFAAEIPPADSAWRETAAEILGQVLDADGDWPARRKTVLRKPLAALFDEAQFLQSLLPINPAPRISTRRGNNFSLSPGERAGVRAGSLPQPSLGVHGQGDPLAEDWSWVRSQMQTLLQLAETFATRLADRKRAGSVLDFHDLEQFALRLLWDFSTGRPTAAAEYWRAKLRFVFVDEYQDINAAQDKIIQGLSREGAAANRFLVGDVKQSIYRFRLAEPAIFRDYARRWRGASGHTIPLRDNFRSAEGLLRLVNSLFQTIMRDEVGGVAYDADAALKFGAPEARAQLGADRDHAPRTDLLLRFKHGRNADNDDETGAPGNLKDAQREARMIARRLQKLVEGPTQVFDPDRDQFRPLSWRDIAILLRSPRGRSEVFAKEFALAGIPLAVARGGFYQSAEVLDLLSLLQLLDNPLQDVPCLAVLRSPLAGLSLDELAEIRLAAPDARFWTALNRAAQRGLSGADTQAKVGLFLERFSRWRKLARLVSLSQCLEEVLAETLYVEWLRAQPHGAERAAGVAAFLRLAQRFDQLQRQGLFRFLKFIEAQQEAEVEPEVPPAPVENAVQLMSIHQSKGLEFPVVVLADLSKQFNEQDLRGDILFDEQFGVCPKIKPPQTGRRYPSLPHWLAQRRQKRELRGEELRLFYVALTRARDRLILAASIPEKSWDEKWTQPQPATPQSIVAAKCAADWLAIWFSNQFAPAPAGPAPTRGDFDHLRWRIVPDEDLPPPAAVAPRAGEPQPARSHSPESALPADISELRSRLEWVYPFTAATRYKAKSSVTALRREAGELDDEAQSIAPGAPTFSPRRCVSRTSQLNAAETGVAHHRFLEHFALENAGDLAAEADRLVREKYLSPAERSALDLDALAAFWNSAPGRRILAEPEGVRRELPFTARFSPAELSEITGANTDPALAEDFVIVQGVADLVVLRPDEIWLVDFKTDNFTPRELPEKVRMYSPQLRLYASALEKIFPQKVTWRALHFLALGRTEEV